MHRFYVEDGESLAAEDARHAARVLRLKPGDPVEIFRGEERWAAVLTEVSEDAARCRLTERLPSTEARLRITLFQGIPKGDKLEMILQKATELGAHGLTPVAMRRSVPQWKEKEAEKKLERWNRIVREAAKQSGRCRPTVVGAPLPFAALPKALAAYDACLVPWENAAGFGLADFHREKPEIRSLAVVIGPEGGIAPEEIEALTAAGARTVTLGPRILRTETAGLACLSALLCLYGEMA